MAKQSFVDRLITNAGVIVGGGSAILFGGAAVGAMAELAPYAIGGYTDAIPLALDAAARFSTEYLPYIASMGSCAAVALSAIEKMSGGRLFNLSAKEMIAGVPEQSARASVRGPNRVASKAYETRNPSTARDALAPNNQHQEAQDMQSWRSRGQEPDAEVLRNQSMDRDFLR